MKRQVCLSVLMMFLGVSIAGLWADDVKIEPMDHSITECLDLTAVAELFQESESLEAFEQALNEDEEGINNLDLNEDGTVDFIRVMEEVEGDVHLIVLQAVLGEDEYQDVAVIEVIKGEDDSYEMQIQGDETLYGADYYISPTVVHVHAWPIFAWIYRPAYHPYRSVYVWGAHPKWWRRRAPVKAHVYRARVATYHSRKNFAVIHATRLRVHRRPAYHPRTSRLVKRRVAVHKKAKVKAKRKARANAKSRKADRKQKRN